MDGMAYHTQVSFSNLQSFIDLNDLTIKPSDQGPLYLPLYNTQKKPEMLSQIRTTKQKHGRSPAVMVQQKFTVTSPLKQIHSFLTTQQIQSPGMSRQKTKINLQLSQAMTLPVNSPNPDRLPQLSPQFALTPKLSRAEVGHKSFYNRKRSKETIVELKKAPSTPKRREFAQRIRDWNNLPLSLSPPKKKQNISSHTKQAFRSTVNKP